MARGRRKNHRLKAAVSAYIEPLEERVLLSRLLGLDVSEHQGNISQTTWNNIAKSNQFAFIRASYGMNSQDAQFANNALRATAAGLYTGFYHYAYYDLAGHTPIGEADHFWNTIKNYMVADGKHIMPVVDVEESGSPSDGETISSWVDNFCARVTSDAANVGLTVYPMVYTGLDFSFSLDGSGASYKPSIYDPLWLADWTFPSDPQTAQPDMRINSSQSPWQHALNPEFSYSCWSFWQYSDSGSVAGISPVDLDVFQGNDDVMQDYIVGSARWAPGTRVEVTRWDGDLNVLPNYDGGGAIGTQSEGAEGTIVGGPEYGVSFIRYKVNFDNGKDGWVGVYDGVCPPGDPNAGTAIYWLSTATPGIASNPNPASSSSPVNSIPTTFTWTAAPDAASYRFYLDGLFKGTTTSTSYTPGSISDGSHIWRVDSINGDVITTGNNWTFVLDTTPPGAGYGGQTPTAGASTMNFTVAYTDSGSGMDVSSFDSSDVTVTGPNGFSAAATFESVNLASDGSPRTVTYQIPAPGGSWTLDDNGVYTIMENSDQTRDVAGNSTPAGTIGTFTAAVPFAYLDGSTLYIDFDGSTNPIVLGASGSELTATQSSTTYPFAMASVANIVADGAGSDDHLTINAPITLPVDFNGGAGNDTLDVNAGALTFNSDLGQTTDNLTLNVSGSGSVAFNALEHLSALNITGARATMAAGGNNTLYLSNLSLDSTAVLDLNDNDLAVNDGDFNTIQALVLGGHRGSPDSTATGIISTVSQNTGGKTILELLDNSQLGETKTDWPTGSGNAVGPNAILGKYTYYGDTNLDGRITGDDYSAVDANLGMIPPPGEAILMGDINFDGKVTGDDYSFIDADLGLGAGNPLVLVPQAPTALSIRRAADFLVGQ